MPIHIYIYIYIYMHINEEVISQYYYPFYSSGSGADSSCILISKIQWILLKTVPKCPRYINICGNKTLFKSYQKWVWGQNMRKTVKRKNIIILRIYLSVSTSEMYSQRKKHIHKISWIQKIVMFRETISMTKYKNMFLRCLPDCSGTPTGLWPKSSWSRIDPG